MVNQGVLWATGLKDKNGNPIKINYQDPSKGDWLAFKGGGLEWSIPGMHSEIKHLGQILAAAYASYRDADPRYKAQQKALGIKPKWPPPNPLEETLQYARSKLNPAAGIVVDALVGQDYTKHAVPWSPDPGKPNWPRIDWTQYLISHWPIPLSGPIRYFYDQLRAKGSSALDAVTITKGLILFGVGATGMHISEDYGADKPPKTSQQICEKTAARNRVAAALLRGH